MLAIVRTHSTAQDDRFLGNGGIMGAASTTREQVRGHGELQESAGARPAFLERLATCSFRPSKLIKKAGDRLPPFSPELDPSCIPIMSFSSNIRVGKGLRSLGVASFTAPQDLTLRSSA